MERILEIATYVGLSIPQADAAGWTALAVECAPCGSTTHLSLWHLRKFARVGFLEEVVGRMRCRACGGEPTTAYLVREVKRPDSFKGMNVTVDEWTEGGNHWVQMLAMTRSVLIGAAAFEEVARRQPGLPVTLRQGIHLIRSTIKEPPPTNVTRLDVKSVETTVPLPAAWHRKTGEK